MVTLRYLATGESLRRLSFSTRIAHNTLSVIINEVLHVIAEQLQNEYLKVSITIIIYHRYAKKKYYIQQIVFIYIYYTKEASIHLHFLLILDSEI